MDEQCAWVNSGRKRHLRILAAILCFYVMFTACPDILTMLLVSATEGLPETTGWYVSGFTGLPEEIREQAVPLGTGLEELSLPDTLEAVMTEEHQISENTENNDSHTEDTEKTEKTVIISGITWQSKPAYDGDTEGTYLFMAVWPEEYEMAEDVSLPEITVTVTEEDKDEDWTVSQVNPVMEKVSGTGYIARAGEPEAVWQSTGGNVDAGSFKDAVDNVRQGGIIGLLTDVMVEDTTIISKSMTITSYDSDRICTIKSITSDTDDGKEKGRIFTVKDVSSFQLQNIILDGGRNEGVVGYHPLILVDNAGVDLRQGTILQNAENIDQNLGGGAVNIRMGMVRLYPYDDIVIRNCKAVHGGGIEINSKGDYTAAGFLMGGGRIENCEAEDGGGIYVNIGMFRMEGGEISGNLATCRDSEAGGTRHGGGAVYVAGGAAKSEVAAVQIQSGTIAGNEAYNGGGILLQGAYAQLEMRGGMIERNEAYNGGGISVIRGNLKLYGGTVTGNTADLYGGGILSAGDFAGVGKMSLIELRGNPKVYGNTAGTTLDRFDNLYLDGNEDGGMDVTSPIALTGPLTNGVRLGMSRWICPDDDEHPYRDMIVSSKDVKESLTNYTMQKADYDRLAQTIEEENKQLYADNMDRYAFIQHDGKIVMVLAVDVTLDKEKLLFEEAGKTGQLKAAVTPGNAPIKDVTWSSSDESVAKVDEHGVVTAMGEGEAVITATTVSPYQASASCRVKVASFYQVTTKAGHGTITYEPKGPLQEKEEVSLVIVPEEGYQLKEGSLRAFQSGNESIEVTIRENNTFVMPDYDVTVTAEFEPVKSSGGGESGGGKDKEDNGEKDIENGNGDENGYENKEEESIAPPVDVSMKQDGNNIARALVEGQDAGRSGNADTDGADASDNRNMAIINPQTGNDMPVWYMLMAVSLIGLVFLGVLVYSFMKIRAYQADLRNGTEELEEIIVKAGISEKTADTGVRKGQKERKAPKEEADSLSVDLEKIDFEALLEINKDVEGWIVCNGCIVNNPIVQAQDNSYYLLHSFMKRENRAGCIFMDYRNESFEDKNVVIYGHNTTDRTMFGSLKDVLKDDFWAEKGRDKIYLVDTDNCLRIYQIFSYYVVENEDYYITTSFKDEEEYSQFLKTIKGRSQRKCGVAVTKEDKILTLSTCYGTAGAKKRLAIHAKEIQPPQ